MKKLSYLFFGLLITGVYLVSTHAYVYELSETSPQVLSTTMFLSTPQKDALGNWFLFGHDPGYTNELIEKVGANGVAAWQKIVPGYALDAIVPDDNGGYYAVTQWDKFNTVLILEPMLMHYDSNGNALWQSEKELIPGAMIAHYVMAIYRRPSDGDLFFVYNDYLYPSISSTWNPPASSLNDFGSRSRGLGYFVTDANGNILPATEKTVNIPPMTDQYCSNELGQAGTVPYDVYDWAECWNWCQSQFGGTTQMCQYNSDGLKNCWTKTVPDGNLNSCTFETSPFGKWPPFFGYNDAIQYTSPTGIRILPDGSGGWFGDISDILENNTSNIDNQGKLGFVYTKTIGNQSYLDYQRVDSSGNTVFATDSKPLGWGALVTKNSVYWISETDDYSTLHLNAYDNNGNLIYGSNGLQVQSFPGKTVSSSILKTDSSGNVYILTAVVANDVVGYYYSEVCLQVVGTNGQLKYPGNGLVIASYPSQLYPEGSWGAYMDVMPDGTAVIYSRPNYADPSTDYGLAVMLVMSNGQMLFKDNPLVISTQFRDRTNTTLPFINGDFAMLYYGDNIDDPVLKSFTRAYQIKTTGGLKAIDSNDDDISAGNVKGIGPEVADYSSNITVKNFDGIPLADVSADVHVDRDWSSVSGDTNSAIGKAYISGLGSAAGAASTHSLYVPIPAGLTSNSMLICPGAASLNDISATCNGATIKHIGDSGVSKVDINDESYWKVDGLTGTGGQALTTTSLEISPNSTDVNVGDLLTVSVTAKNSNSDVDTSYNGVVHFSSTSGTAILPGNYEFGAIDAGQKTFTNQVEFLEPGTFTITVIDISDGTLTATTGDIHVSGTPITLTPTPSTTMIATNTPSINPTLTRGSIAPTPTNNVNPSLRPTLSNGTILPTPTVTVTGSVTPPPSQSCVDNPSQILCQIDVSIVNVTATVSGTQVNICWDTNIATKGSVVYGVITSGTYSQSTPTELDYKTTGHCVLITGLTNDTEYIYRITATSVAGRQNTYEDTFKVGNPANIGVNPSATPTTTSPASGCIQINNNGVAFNGLGQAVIYYSVSHSASCHVDYGSNSSSLNFSSPTTTGTSHRSVLTLNNITSGNDLYYNISCSTQDTSVSPNKCSLSGIITQQQYGPYNNIGITDLPLTGVLGQLLGTSAQASGTITDIGAIGIGTSVALISIAYPQWLQYGLLFFFKRNKKKMWGLVYDLATKRPLSFAVIRVTDTKTGAFIKQTVTDTKGRYGLILDRGPYTIEVTHDNYESSVRDIILNEPEGTLALDFSLSREKGKEQKRSFREAVQKILYPLSLILTVLGLIFTTLAVALSPSIFNITVLVLYGVQGIIYVMTSAPRGWGKITSMSGDYIQGAFVRLFDKQAGRQIDAQITDNKGRFGFILPDNNESYLLMVNAEGYRFPSPGQVDLYRSPSGQEFIEVNKNSIKDLNISLS